MDYPRVMERPQRLVYLRDNAAFQFVYPKSPAPQRSAAVVRQHLEVPAGIAPGIVHRRDVGAVNSLQRRQDLAFYRYLTAVELRGIVLTVLPAKENIRFPRRDVKPADDLVAAREQRTDGKLRSNAQRRIYYGLSAAAYVLHSRIQPCFAAHLLTSCGLVFYMIIP